MIDLGAMFEEDRTSFSAVRGSAGEDESSLSDGVEEINSGVLLDESPDGVGSSFLSSEHQSRKAALVLHVNVCAVVNKEGADLSAVVVSSDHESSVFDGVELVDLGASQDESLDGIEMAVFCGDHERRTLVVGLEVVVGSELHEHGADGRVAERSSDVEGSLVEVVDDVELGSFGDEKTGDLWVVCARSRHQCGPISGGFEVGITALIEDGATELEVTFFTGSDDRLWISDSRRLFKTLESA